MAYTPQKFREVVFQLLFSYDLTHKIDDELLQLLMTELEVSQSMVEKAKEHVLLLLEKQPDIDALITKASKEYAFARIAAVERNVLRLGVFELLYDDTIPPKVAISEAIRLTRKFGTPESATFVNAVLDNLYAEKK